MGFATTTTPLPLLQASLPSDPATKWAVLGFAAFALVYFTLIRPQRKRKDPLARPPGAGALAQQRSVEREMSNLLVEMSEMARQMTAQLDTRAAKLELLIKEADDRIAAIKAAAAGITVLPPADAEPPPARVFSLPAPSPVDEPAPAPAAVDPRHAAVYELADQGHSPQEIARELERPNGEIELILALRGGPADGSRQ